MGRTCGEAFDLSVVEGIVKIVLMTYVSVQFSSVAQSCLALCDLMNRSRPPCPSPTPGVHPNPCPSSRWCHPTISSSVVPFSSCNINLTISECIHQRCHGLYASVVYVFTLFPLPKCSSLILIPLIPYSNNTISVKLPNPPFPWLCSNSLAKYSNSSLIKALF